MANNPIDPPIVQVKKTLDRAGISTVNRGFGSMATPPVIPRAPEGGGEGWPENLADLGDVDLSTPPTPGQALVWDGTLWVPGTAGGGGGGGSSWDKIVDLPLTTLTGWTLGTGTWTASASGIRQSASTAVQKYAMLDTRIPSEECVVEVEMRIDVATHSTNGRGGIVIGASETGAYAVGGDGIFLSTNGSLTQISKVYSEREGQLAWITSVLDVPQPTGTWMKLRVHKVAQNFGLWVDEVFRATHRGDSPVRAMGRLTLYSYTTDVTFRNLKVWTPAMPV